MKLNNVLGYDATHRAHHVQFAVCHSVRVPKLRTKTDPNLLDAALGLGCTPVQAFFKVIINEIMPGILRRAHGVLNSLDDFVISYFVYISFVTLPVEIYNYTKKPLQPKIYALFRCNFLGSSL